MCCTENPATWSSLRSAGQLPIHRRNVFAVADLCAAWPAHDAAVDLLVSVFAPKSFREMARVLRPSGWLTIAYPGWDHIWSSVENASGFSGRTIRVPGDMPRWRRASSARSPSSGSASARFSIGDCRAAILTGPNARHVDPSFLGVSTAPLPVIFDITSFSHGTLSGIGSNGSCGSRSPSGETFPSRLTRDIQRGSDHGPTHPARTKNFNGLLELVTLALDGLFDCAKAL